MSPGGFCDVVGSDAREADVEVVTSGGMRIPAHSSTLAMSSPVLESILERPQKHHHRRGSERRVSVIPILGVPCEAVSAFIRYLYTPTRCYNDSVRMLDEYAIHLLALSHVYAVHQLKQQCIKSLSSRLTTENVVDVLQLARLCDAPDLRLTCLKLVSTKFKAVEKTEGWKFLHKHDPWLELDILQFIDESESRRKRNKKHRLEQHVYVQLSEAMDCLSYIWSDGLLIDHAASRMKNCSTWNGVQMLLKHFATCDKRINGEPCCQCKRMIQFLRLHSCLCEQTHHQCRVPLCSQFKMKMQHEKKKEDAKWRLLAKKLVVARAASALSVAAAKRKRDVIIHVHDQQQLLSHREQLRNNHHRLQSFRLCQTETSQMTIVPPV